MSTSMVITRAALIDRKNVIERITILGASGMNGRALGLSRAQMSKPIRTVTRHELYNRMARVTDRAAIARNKLRDIL